MDIRTIATSAAWIAPHLRGPDTGKDLPALIGDLAAEIAELAAAVEQPDGPQFAKSERVIVVRHPETGELEVGGPPVQLGRYNDVTA